MTAANDNGENRSHWFLGLFIVAWFWHANFALIGVDNSLLSMFQFRQLQTAMSVLYYPAGGLPLAYETPLFGPPWSAPLEFPLYQATVASWMQITGDKIEVSGRIVGWIWFQALLPAVYLLLGSLGVARQHRWVSLALLITSPIYLFYSRAFLIESTALCTAIWFTATSCRWLSTGHRGWLGAALLLGGLAAAVKPTTMVPGSVATGLFALSLMWSSPRRRVAGVGQVITRTLAVFSLPLLLGLWWQHFTSTVRTLNPETAFLDVMFGYFSFGDLAQRFSLEYWTSTTHIWRVGILSQASLIITLFLFLLAPSRQKGIAAGLVLSFLSGQLIFSNLYLVHDYYFYATGVFLILGLGVLLTAPWHGVRPAPWKICGLTAMLIFTQWREYAEFYLPFQRENTPPSELAQAIADITEPEKFIIVLGQDWDAELPFYARRRALMLIAGRERDPQGMGETMARLNPEKVGAVIILGYSDAKPTYFDEAFGSLDTGPTPLLVNNDNPASVWVPRANQSFAREHIPEEGYETLRVVVPTPKPGEPVTLLAREINHIRGFDLFTPRPTEATGPAIFTHADLPEGRVLNSHTPSRLTLPVPEGSQRLRINFGITAAAYQNGNATNGVDFVVLDLRQPAGQQEVYRRLLDPLNQPGDRGLQSMELTLAPSGAGELQLLTEPGPNGNASWDWSYWGQVILE